MLDILDWAEVFILSFFVVYTNFSGAFFNRQFREDESRARTDNSAENLNALRHWAFNLLKADTSLRGSFSDKQFKCLLDDAVLDKIIASALCS